MLTASEKDVGNTCPLWRVRVAWPAPSSFQLHGEQKLLIEYKTWQQSLKSEKSARDPTGNAPSNLSSSCMLNQPTMNERRWTA